MFEPFLQHLLNKQYHLSATRIRLKTCNYATCDSWFNPRTTSKVAPHHGTRERGIDGPPPHPSWVFALLQYLETIFPLVESLWCAVQDGVYIMGGGVVGGCDVSQERGKDGRHLGLYQKLEIFRKRQKLTIFDARYVDCNIIKHFAFCAFSPKKDENTRFCSKNGLTRPPTYDIISRNHTNRFLPNLCQNVPKGYAYNH